MKDIKVRKDVLLAKLEENKGKHRAVFEAALGGFREEATRILEQNLAYVKEGKTRKLYISMPVPKDHTSDYDRVIGMVQMDQDPMFVLSELDYSRYVDDNWEWTSEFGTTSMRYAAGATISNYGGKFSDEH